MTLSRREFVQLAAAMGASLAWAGSARASRTKWREAARPLPRRRRLGRSRPQQRDPVDPPPVRRCRAPPADGRSCGGRRVPPRRCASARTGVGSVRLDEHGCWSAGSSPRTSIGTASPTPTETAAAIGRTITAPRPNDPRPVNFAFVSCQDVNESKLNGYRRMIFEDERARPEDQLDFVLHLGDFIYEVVQYPEEGKPRFDRKLYEVARIPDSLKVRNYPSPDDARGIPRSVEGLSRRSRPAGRARPLAVRVHLGQSRILVAGLAEHPESAVDRAARADRSRSPPTRPGSRISRRG